MFDILQTHESGARLEYPVVAAVNRPINDALRMVQDFRHTRPDCQFSINVAPEHHHEGITP